MEQGVVQEAAVHTDAMDWRLAQTVERALTGCRFHLPELRERLGLSGLDGQVAQDLCALLAEQDF